MLKLSEYESKLFSIPTSILQDSLLSFILYLFYNADLLNINNRSNLWAVAASWIDDIGFIMSDTSTESNCQMLQALHTEAETWARWHASVFTPIKYELIHFTNKPNNHDISVILTLRPHEIPPTKTCQVLNIILDLQLEFEAHI